jgi:putative superfamily III holin-X
METTSVRDQPVREPVPGETAPDLSTRELVQDLSRQTSTLIRQEMRLAQAELTEKGRHAGKGAGMFGGAGLIALYGVGALIAAAILGLATVIEPWIAAAAIGAGLLLIAGVLALTGKKELDEMGPPKPEQTIDSVQRDVETVKERARS